MWYAAYTGQTGSHGALAQCWHSIGTKRADTGSPGSSPPSQYRSIRIQVISRPLRISGSPTVGMLFSA